MLGRWRRLFGHLIRGRRDSGIEIEELESRGFGNVGTYDISMMIWNLLCE